MTAEQNVYLILSTHPGLTALVSNRIYPDEAPANATLPYVVYRRFATEPSVTHDQMDAGASHIDGCHFQLTVIAATQLAAANIVWQARLALEQSQGLRAIWTDERALAREEGAQANGRSADFLVWKSQD